jgi:MoaA/NifB/PqqE/SkfB family radical SAM enzyme
MEKKVKRLIKWTNEEKVSPLTLELNVTSRCNLKCRFCWLRSANSNYSKELNDEQLIRIVNEAIELEVEEFRFPGSGEPLMRKEILLELMKRIKDNGKMGLLISNGTLFNEKIIRKMIELNWDILTISLEGPDAETHDYLTQVKGSFSQMIKNLELIKKWKKKLGEENPWLRMNVVLTNKNYDKLEKIVELGAKFNFKEIILQPMTIFSEEGKRLRVKNIESVNKHLEVAEERARNLGIKTNVNSFIKNVIIERTNEMENLINEEIKRFNGNFLSVPCYEPFYNLIIMPGGEAGPCAIAGGITEASVKNTTLKDVWFGKCFETFRKKLLNRELFPFCYHCCIPIFLENKRLRKELARVI